MSDLSSLGPSPALPSGGHGGSRLGEEPTISSTVSFREVSKWYGAVIGVNQVSLEIGPGITGLLGPNGAGKSTLMKLICGQLRPSQGEVRVLGRSAWRSPAARRAIGFTPEADAFHEEMPAREFVLSMARLSGLRARAARDRTELAIERTGMTAHAHKRLRACSKGMRQRIKIAQAIVHDPEVLVLDEPLSGVDPTGRMDLMALFRQLRDEGKTVLVSSHILHEVEQVTDTIVLMARGRVLAAGKLSRIRELLSEYPLTVGITATRGLELAAALFRDGLAVGVTLEGEETAWTPVGAAVPPTPDRPRRLLVKVRRPDDFFRALPPLLLELGSDVVGYETLDASAEAIFRYLLGRAVPGLPEEGS